MIITVKVKLEVPKEFTGGYWSRETALDSIIGHWLEEGYYVSDCRVELPDGIEYKGFTIEEES